MKAGSIVLSALALAMLAFASPAAAEDAVADYTIDNVTQRPDFSGQMSGVTFYFGDVPHPAGSTVEADVTTSQRTRKFGRSSEEACQWVMLSALQRLRDRAQAVGGNAVVNIRSNWRNVETSSRTQYRCAAGLWMAGVALKADIVRLP